MATANVAHWATRVLAVNLDSMLVSNCFVDLYPDQPARGLISSIVNNSRRACVRFPFLTGVYVLTARFFRSSGSPAGLSQWADSTAEAGASTAGYRNPPNAVATGIPGYVKSTSEGTSFERSFTAKPSMTQHQHQPHQQKVAVGTGLESVKVDQPKSSAADGGGANSLGKTQQAPIPAAPITLAKLKMLLASREVGAGPTRSPVGGVSSSGAPGGPPALQPPAAATPDLSTLLIPAKEGPRDAAAAAAGDETPTAVVSTPLAVLGDEGGAGTDTSHATPQGVAGISAREASAPVNASAAVSEDLAYSHRGSVLHSYAITGSVLVAAGAPARLRVTDPQVHIAKATVNAAVAEENTAVSYPATREYLCKAGAVQQAGAPPKFVPTLLYRCSSAVKVLPVRVNCRLKIAGNSVLVWAQVIANPQLPQPLSGVSVLVNLPFSPRNEEVRNDPFDKEEVDFPTTRDTLNRVFQLCPFTILS